MTESEDHYLADDVFDALVDRLAGQDDERADEVVWTLMDARIWPARIVNRLTL
jgi:hypothetical protein